MLQVLRAQVDRARSCDRSLIDDLPRLTSWRPSVLLATLAINVLSLALPIVILQVYDRVIPNQSVATLTFLVLGLVMAVLLDGLLRMARSVLAGWSGAKFEHEIGCRAVSRLLRADLQVVEGTAVGKHLDRLGMIDSLRDFYATQGPFVLVDLPFVVLFLSVIYLVAGPLVLVPLVLLLVLVGVVVWLGGRLRASIDQRATMDERRYSFIIELLTGIHTIKAMAMETLMLRRYERLLEGTSRSIYDVSYDTAMGLNVGIVASQVTMVAVTAFGSLAVLAGDLTVGGLAACTLLAGRTLQPLLRAAGVWRQFQTVRVGHDRLSRIFHLPMRPADKTAQVSRIEGAISLRDVGFRYGKDEDAPWLFRHLDLTIEPGETIGIRSGNGAGKTTLLWLLSGGLPAATGTISIDGVDIAGWDAASLRRQVVMLPEHGSLFNGTIRDNLTMFNDGADLPRIMAVADALGLTNILHRLPRGLDTMVGQSSMEELPGGVRQLIVIARVLGKEPRIVLFDEANTSLDQQSDILLCKYLATLKPQCTMVLVSHRPSTLRLADQVLLLQDGTLVAAPEPQQPALAPGVKAMLLADRPASDDRGASPAPARQQVRS